MRSTARQSLCLSTVLLPLIIAPLFAAPIYTDARVTAASASNADMDTASRRATQEALLNALRMFAQKQVASRTWQAERPTIELFLRTRGTAYVSSSTLQKRRIEGGNTVHIWMIVGLQEDALRAALLKSLTRSNTVVVGVWPLDETTDVQAGSAETQIADAMLASGCNVISRSQIEEIRWQQHLAALSRGDYLAAEALGLGFLADIAVRVRLSAKRSQNNQGIISAVASADVEGVDSHTARVLFTRHLGPEKGFGLDLARAMDDACSKVNAQVAEYVGGRMVAHRQRCVRNVRVVSSDLLTTEQWSGLADELRRAPLIREVQVGDGALVCTVEGGALTVAVAADGVAGYRVVSLSEDTVRIATRTS